MPVTDIVSGQRKPGPIGFGDVGGNLCIDLPEITRAAEDTLPRIRGVRYLRLRSRVGGELHEAFGAGRRGCAWIPFRFLVSDRGQQAPVLTALLRSLFEPLFVERQTTLKMTHEARRVADLQIPRAAVVMFDDGREFTVQP